MNKTAKKKVNGLIEEKLRLTNDLSKLLELNREEIPEVLIFMHWLSVLLSDFQDLTDHLVLDNLNS